MIDRAKQICSRHYYVIPAIRDVKRELGVNLASARDLVVSAWDSVPHPSGVSYERRVEEALQFIREAIPAACRYADETGKELGADPRLERLYLILKGIDR